MVCIPEIGFGTGQLQGEKAYDAVAAALDAGYRLIDTGAIYGNEVAVGRAILASGVRRDDISVITKGAHDEIQHGYRTVLEQFEASLARLALDYVDYYLVHWPVNPTERRETWRAYEEIRATRRAREIGVSNYGIHHLQELADCNIQPAVNQIEFHPYIYSEQQDIVTYCQDKGMTVIGYSTFADGQAEHDPIVETIATNHHVMPRQVLTRWSMQHGVVPLVRSGSAVHIAENIKVDGFTLSDSEMVTLDGLRGRRQFRDPHVLS